MPQIISSDTTWKTGQVITLTDKVQVAQGVTLTIEPGVVVDGGSSHHFGIQAFGTVNAIGTPAAPIVFKNVAVSFGPFQSFQQLGTWNIDFADISNSWILPDVGIGSGYFSMSNSFVESIRTGNELPFGLLGDQPLFWDGPAGSAVSRNVFVDLGTLRIVNSGFNVTDNVFVDTFARTGDQAAPYLTIMTGIFSRPVEVHGNSFDLVSRLPLAMAEGFPYATADVSGNYFGTTAKADIDSLILDRNDSLGRGVVTGIDPLLSAPDPDAPFWGAGSNNDVWSGSAASNRAWGNAGNDSFRGNGGDDRIEGGAGIDTAAYSGPRGSYTILARSNQAQIVDTTGDDGADTLIDVERLTFSDTSVALDLGGAAGTAAKILGATFGAGAVHNHVYVGIGLSLLDSGSSLAEVAGLAVREALRGEVSHESVVNLLYRNVVGSAPPEGDRGYFVNLLASGQYSVGGLTIFAAETGLNLANIGFAGLAQGGIEYTPY